ncbi:hypothetical protein [Sinorhizobium meliloti]|nr:hypothetical protein [Sinorhizobium meliloti]MDE3854851.1 hypothetical protein [Sinorhizobium meliloti]
MSHLIKRRGTMPAESIVYRDWRNGIGRDLEARIRAALAATATEGSDRG